MVSYTMLRDSPVYILLCFSSFWYILFLDKRSYLFVYFHFHASLHRLLPLVQHLYCSYSDKPIRIALFMRSLEIPLLWVEMAQHCTNRYPIPENL